MSNPTSNFGWQMPTPTDLVTDLPADFEVFGQAVDTSLADLKGGTTGQVLSKTTNADMDFTWVAPTAGDIEGVTAGVGISGGGTSGTVTITNDMATTITASGDIVVGTGSGTYDNLPIGTTGQVLTADTTVSPYKVKWATASGGTPSYSLINTGGTTLSGSSNVTVSGISGMSKLIITIFGASAGDQCKLRIRFNGDTGSNYEYAGHQYQANTSYPADQPTRYDSTADSSFQIAKMANDVGSTMGAYIWMDGANSTGFKAVTYSGSGTYNAGTTLQAEITGGGLYKGTSTISSVSIGATVGTFDAGTVYVYGSAV